MGADSLEHATSIIKNQYPKPAAATSKITRAITTTRLWLRISPTRYSALEVGLGTLPDGRIAVSLVVLICARVGDSPAGNPVATTPGSDKIAVAGSSVEPSGAETDPCTSEAPSSRQKLSVSS